MVEVVMREEEVIDLSREEPALTSLCVAAGPQSNMRRSAPSSTTCAEPYRSGVGVGVPAPKM